MSAGLGFLSASPASVAGRLAPEGNGAACHVAAPRPRPSHGAAFHTCLPRCLQAFYGRAAHQQRAPSPLSHWQPAQWQGECCSWRAAARQQASPRHAIAAAWHHPSSRQDTPLPGDALIPCCAPTSSSPSLPRAHLRLATHSPPLSPLPSLAHPPALCHPLPPLLAADLPGCSVPVCSSDPRLPPHPVRQVRAGVLRHSDPSHRGGGRHVPPRSQAGARRGDGSAGSAGRSCWDVRVHLLLPACRSQRQPEVVA